MVAAWCGNGPEEKQERRDALIELCKWNCSFIHMSLGLCNENIQKFIELLFLRLLDLPFPSTPIKRFVGNYF
jgi:hypothetical protein